MTPLRKYHPHKAQSCLGYRVNPFSANPAKWSNTLKQFIGKLPTSWLSVFDHFVKLALKGLSHSRGLEPVLIFAMIMDYSCHFRYYQKNSFMWSSKLETAFSVRRKLVKNTRKHKINCHALVLYMIKSVTQTHSSIYASDMFHSFLACLKGSRQGSNWSW